VYGDFRELSLFQGFSVDIQYGQPFLKKNNTTGLDEASKFLTLPMSEGFVMSERLGIFT
jgi:hypothetical protein